MERSKLRVESKNIRGLKSAWLRGGPTHAPILLFLHGYPDSPESWDQQFSHFLEHFEVVAPYARGIFPSDPSPKIERYGCEAVALDHLEILDSIDPERQRPVVVVGHDLGAAQAWYLAPLIEKRLASLVILNGLSLRQMGERLGRWQQNLRSWYIYAFQLPMLPERLLRRFPGPLLKFAHRLGGLEAPARPQVAATIRALVHPINQYRAHWRALPQAMRDSPRRIDAPVLVLWGEDDRFLPPPSREEILKWAKNPTIRILKGNHWIHRQDAPQVNRLIQRHLGLGGASCSLSAV